MAPPRTDPPAGAAAASARAGRPRRPARRSRSKALVRACHPEPTVAVTGLSAALAVAVGLGPAGTALVAAAVLTGQLSIGWSNDLVDARRDRATGRGDKPVATGLLSARTVGTATAAALGATVVLSLLTGPGPGMAHLGVVAGGWAYNLGLKRGVASVVPYAVAFGLLPAFVVLAAGGEPPGWLVLAGALLGSGAHFFNALPDLADDRATGVRSLPVVLGPLGARVTGSALLVAAVAVLTVAPEAPSGPWTSLGLATAVVLSVLAGLLDRGGRSRRPFLLVLVVAAVGVALLVGRASTLA